MSNQGPSASIHNTPIPAALNQTHRVQPPTAPAAERFTVVVNDVPVRELLLALARDAELELDIATGIQGKVSLNAVDRKLTDILQRIARQNSLRYRLHDDALFVEPDTPFFKTYTIDYTNVQRESIGSIELATKIGSVGTEASDSGGSNNSQARVVVASRNQFWDSLTANLAAIIGITLDQPQSTAKLITNRETGLVSVRATEAEHQKIDAFLKRLITSAHRQVLIEATVVEVQLSDRYQAGIDWSLLAKNTNGFNILQDLSADALSTAPVFTVSYSDTNLGGYNLSATLSLLHKFGEVQVLSSPKIMALNNQTALLKVVDNRVFFTVDVDSTFDEGVQNIKIETELNTVPVGLVMNVTPFISSTADVLLNVRPSVSRILGFVRDPNPELANAGVENLIPEIQVREMESMLRVASGQIAIIGGLMETSLNKHRRGIPGLRDLPLVGNTFDYRDQDYRKSELLVFLKPTVIQNASVDHELKQFKQFMPSASILEPEGE